MPTAGRHGASPGLSLRASSIFTYSAVARVSSSASTRPPKGRTLVCNADPGRPLLLGHGFRSADIPWNYSSSCLPRRPKYFASTSAPTSFGPFAGGQGPALLDGCAKKCGHRTFWHNLALRLPVRAEVRTICRGYRELTGL